MNKKGGFDVVKLLLIFVMLVIYTAFLPAINEIISEALPHLDLMSQLAIQTMPLLILIMIIVVTISDKDKGQQSLMYR